MNVLSQPEFIITDNDIKSYRLIHKEKWRELINEGDLNEVKKFTEIHGVHFYNDWPLRYAVWQRNFELVVYFVGTGANVNNYFEDDSNEGCHCDLGHMSALTIAAATNHVEMIKFLIESGADIHIDEDKSLKTAAYNGNYEAVKFLIKLGAKVCVDNNAPLKYAVEHGYLEIVKYLINKGANITSCDYCEFIGSDRKGQNVIKYLIQSRIIGIDKLPFNLREKYDKLLNYTVVFRPISNEINCLIGRIPIEISQEYYVCSNKEDHVYSKDAMDQWNKLECLLCSAPLNINVYINASNDT